MPAALKADLVLVEATDCSLATLNITRKRDFVIAKPRVTSLTHSLTERR